MSGRILDNKSIVIYGAQKLFQQHYGMLSRECKPEYIFMDGSGDSKGLKVIEAVKDIKKLINPFVLIASENRVRILEIRKELDELKIPYDHMIFNTTVVRFTGAILNAMEVYDFVDLSNNCFKFPNTINDNIEIILERYARNCNLKIGTIDIKDKLCIMIFGDNAYCKIGDNNIVVEMTMMIGINGSVEIGDDGMFSRNIVLYQTDQHPIFDISTMKCINNSKKLYIGNHVWVGRNVELMGGTYIDDGSIIGSHAVTSSIFGKNVIIVGCPAKVVRENICWAKDVFGWGRDQHDFSECVDQSALKYLDLNQNDQLGYDGNKGF